MIPRNPKNPHSYHTDAELRDALNVLHEEHNAWPACWRCGVQVREPLVALGWECLKCHARIFEMVMAPFRPMRRTLPDDTVSAAPARNATPTKVLRFPPRGLVR